MSSNQLISNRFRLGSLLGKGAMGAVYQAHDTLLKRDVAIKVLSGAGLGTEDRLGLMHEAQAAAGLSHPNIVTVFDVGGADSTPYIVMELIQGESLREYRPTELDDITTIAKQLCAALDHAHANGVIHRDLKPENVLVTVDGTTKLADFSLARSLATRLTGETRIMGTLHYMAPEIILGEDVDGRADLYALGVMLYELTTGQVPFDAGDPVSILSQHLYAPVVPPQAKNSDIPAAFDYLIVRLLAKRPENRPASAAEVLESLEQLEVSEEPSGPFRELSLLDRIVRGRLVGREQELGDARELWNQTCSGRGQLLLISGEPGVGKTRLVHELVTQARATGGISLVGASYADGGSPYEPFRQILREALREFDSSDGLPDGVLADLLKVSPELRLQYPDVPANPPADPQDEQRRLLENMVILFSALSDRASLLIVLEDCHWADGGTRMLLRHLARNTRHQRLMIAITYREAELRDAQSFHKILLDFGRERLSKGIQLNRLDREETNQLLSTLFDEEITPEFLDGIFRETEGNPFYIEEVCKALVESGRLTYKDGRWDRPSIDELGIPQSIQVAVQSRVRALPDETQQVLDQAAILGREFDIDTLRRAAGICEANLIEALEEAERAQLIEEASPDRGRTFGFVHALIPAALIAALRAPRRRRLHLQAAVALETTHPEAFEALAYQYMEGGEIDKGMTYLVRAGDRARAIYAHQEAIDSYQQALEHLKERGVLEQAARTLMKLGLTYHNAFEFQQARQAYQEGFALWQQVGVVKPDKPPPAAPHALRGLIAEPIALDPALSTTVVSHRIIDQLYSGLVEQSPELDIVPDVAHSWEVMDGGRRYVFYLRNDVFWSDGVQVTAADFVAAWQRVLDPLAGLSHAHRLYDIKNAQPYHRGKLEPVDALGVRARDAFTLEVELERPVSTFLHLLSYSLLFPVPQHILRERGDGWVTLDGVVSNGPFQLEAWYPGESLVLKTNPTYHGRSGGNLKRVEMAFRSGVQAEEDLRQYQQDQLDVLFLDDVIGPSGVLRQYANLFADQFLSAPRLATHYLGFDTRRPPLDDPRVRRAFAVAIDRDHLFNVVWGGRYFPATGGFVPPGMPGHSAGAALPFDPKKASRLLAEAGYPGGHGFPVVTSARFDDPSNISFTEYLHEQWLEHLGIKVGWDTMSWRVFLDRLDQHQLQMYVMGWSADVPDPGDFLSSASWRRDSGWQNEAYDQLVDRARGIMDQEERMKLYRQAERILIDEVPILPLGYFRLHFLVKPWVRRFPTSPMKWWYWKDVIIDPH